MEGKFVVFHEPRKSMSVHEIIQSFFSDVVGKFNPYFFLLFSFIIFIASNIPYAFLLSFRHYSRPFSDDLPLPDLLYKMTQDANFSSINTAVKVIHFFILCSSFICFILHQRRLVIFQSFFIISSILIIFKMIIMIGTDVPDPSSKCYNYPSSPYSRSLGSALKTLFSLDSCYNLMFSGFVSIVTLCTLYWTHYFHPFVGLFYWLMTLAEAFLCVFARRNYTMDVIVAILLTLTTFEITHRWFEKLL